MGDEFRLKRWNSSSWCCARGEDGGVVFGWITCNCIGIDWHCSNSNSSSCFWLTRAASPVPEDCSNSREERDFLFSNWIDALILLMLLLMLLVDRSNGGGGRRLPLLQLLCWICFRWSIIEHFSLKLFTNDDGRWFCCCWCCCWWCCCCIISVTAAMMSTCPGILILDLEVVTRSTWGLLYSLFLGRKGYSTWERGLIGGG